jgi:hypothetical protein
MHALEHAAAEPVDGVDDAAPPGSDPDEQQDAGQPAHVHRAVEPRSQAAGGVDADRRDARARDDDEP